MKGIKDHKKRANMIPPKETNKAAITDPKIMEICELSDKKFRIILLRKFNGLQENRQTTK